MTRQFFEPRPAEAARVAPAGHAAPKFDPDGFDDGRQTRSHSDSLALRFAHMRNPSCLRLGPDSLILRLTRRQRRRRRRRRRPAATTTTTNVTTNATTMTIDD
eukprot:9481141-Pyramimonas_sp.AAC.1